MNYFEDRVIDLLDAAIPELERDVIQSAIEIPPDVKLGHFAFPCFKLAKIYRNAPNKIAPELKEKIGEVDFLERVEAVGPYLNFFIAKPAIAEYVLTRILDEKDRYGSSDMGKGKKVLVEFSSTNIAKPFHIGHIRSTVIGNVLRNIYRFLGFDTVAINHLGDYGTQFGMAIAAYKRWGDEETIAKDPIREILKLYVRFNEEAEKDPALQDEAREYFRKLESGDEEAVAIWQWIRKISLEEFMRVYDLLGISFDSYAGESFYSDKMGEVIDLLNEKNLLVESEGALVVDLSEDHMPPAIVQKADGGTIYLTRDLAAAIYRKHHYDFDKNLYVVASQQNLHFRQLFRVLELMGFEWAKDCEHIAFGMISMEDGAMSTRKGRVIFLEDVLNQSIEKTKQIIEERNPDLPNKDEVAKQVGIGAIVFQELFNNRIKDYTFVWDKTLNFEGETGPYVQYTYARASSIMASEELSDFDPSLLTDDAETELLMELYGFPKAIVDAMEKNEPFYITRQVVEIAKKFNRFYVNCPIRSAENETKKARLALTEATRTVIRTGLSILGIEAPERM